MPRGTPSRPAGPGTCASRCTTSFTTAFRATASGSRFRTARTRPCAWTGSPAKCWRWWSGPSEVDELSDGRTPPNLHVETDMAFGGMMAAGANRRSFRWLPDPGLSHAGELREEDAVPARHRSRSWPGARDRAGRNVRVVPRLGAAVRQHRSRALRPGHAADVSDHRAVGHGESADDACRFAERAHRDQRHRPVRRGRLRDGDSHVSAAASTWRTRSRRRWNSARNMAAYARGKGIEIGSYSLLASRRIGGGNDVVMPPGQKPAFGNSPCLASRWGTNYFRRLYEFHRDSGFTLAGARRLVSGRRMRKRSASRAIAGWRTRAGTSGGKFPTSTSGAAARAST